MSSTTDTNHLRIGEQLKLNIEVSSDTPLTVLWPMPSIEIEPFEVVADSTFSEQVYPDSFLYRKEYVLAVFDSGSLNIPSFAIPYLLAGKEPDTLYSASIPVRVDFVEVDTSQPFKPIKPIVEYPRSWKEYWRWYLLVLMLALIGLALWWWLRKRKEKGEEAMEITDRRPAHEIALEKLEKLELEGLWQKGEVKEYHDRVSDIVREYIERRFGIPALESTSYELMVFMQKSNVRLADLERLKRILTIADIVKFAKGEPSRDQNIEVMELAREFIEDTAEKEKKEEVES